MKKLAFILVCILSAFQLSAKDWNLIVNYKGMYRQITSFDYLDSLNYCCFTLDTYKSTNDSLYYSTNFFITKDAGKTWDSTHFESYNYYRGVCTDSSKENDTISTSPTKFQFLRYIDKNTLIAIGEYSIVIKSTDAGKSWDTLRHRNKNNNHMGCLSFDQKGRGYLIYLENRGDSSIYMSDDFAVTQYKVPILDSLETFKKIRHCYRFEDSIYKFVFLNHHDWSYEFISSYDRFKSFEFFTHFQIVPGYTVFLTPEEGYFLGFNSVIDTRSFMYRTYNGGKSWNMLYKPTNKLEACNNNIVRINNNILVATDGFYIKISYDNGYNWILDSVSNNNSGYEITDFRIIGNKLFCKDFKAVFYIEFEDIINSIGIPENKENILSPYPNPVIFGKFNIDCNPDLISSIILYDVNGKSFSLKYDNIKYGITAYIPEFFSKGIYYLRVIDTDNNIIKSSPIIIR